MSRRPVPRRRADGPRRWFGRGRTRALLTLGVLAGLAVTSTTAYWTDEATIDGGTISTGTLDLTAGPTTGSEQLTGPGPNTWTSTLLAVSSMVPGESVAATFVVRNSGSAPLRFNATVRSTSNDLTAGSTGLRLQIYDNGTTATNTGTLAGADRSGTCNGSQVYVGYLSTTASADVFPSDVALAATGATRSLCVRAWLDTAAPTSLQGRSTSVQVTLGAEQLGAP
ncbi:SipW-dependent-type signal peptide-containing protein [Nocardioides sp. SYSU DS0651]|uniref:SipW-dependent-type signal peptide-containing protein n=1 Tax=Nocardioides sp. SYSU DS0651 TaxID=3415955 RepID=UPI003F4B98D5